MNIGQCGKRIALLTRPPLNLPARRSSSQATRDEDHPDTQLVQEDRFGLDRLHLPQGNHPQETHWSNGKDVKRRRRRQERPEDFLLGTLQLRTVQQAEDSPRDSPQRPNRYRRADANENGQKDKGEVRNSLG